MPRAIRFVMVLLVTLGRATIAAAQPAPSTPDGWVVLPADEYRALRQRAVPPAPIPPVPSIAAVLTRVDYDLRAESESAVGRVSLTIDVLREGWTKVAIPPGLIARDAQSDGRPVVLVPGKEPHVLLSRLGRSLVSLDVALPLIAGPGTESIAIPPSAAPISRVALVVPRTAVTLTAGDGFVAEHSETVDESRWVAYGRPRQPLTLSWKRKVEDRRAEQPLRTRARILQLVGLGEELGHASASVRVEVQQGLAREIVLAVPSGLTVTQVDGPTVGDWDASGGALRVRLLEPVSTEVSFVVQGDIRAPRDGAIAIPLLRMPSAERESGGVAVDILGSGELSGRQLRGMDLADASELGDVVAGRESPSMSAFRFRPTAGTDPRSLDVTVVRYTPQAVLIANIEEARYRALMSEDGRVLVEARYAVRNNQRSFLKVSLPDGAALWSADVAGRPVRPGVADTNGVLLPLEKGRAGEEAPTFAVSLVYFQRADEWGKLGTTTLALPALDLPISRTGVELSYSPRFRVDLRPGTFRTEQNVGPTAEAFLRPTAVPTAPSSTRSLDQRAATGFQTLIDRFNRDAGVRTSIGTLPVHVQFPAFGASIFLVSELTAETQAPSIDVAFKRVRD